MEILQDTNEIINSWWGQIDETPELGKEKEEDRFWEIRKHWSLAFVLYLVYLFIGLFKTPINTA